jgi:NAD-dependent SIR2 family protein deacetylase
MDYVDKTLTCLQCGDSFMFSVSEQEFFSRRGRKKEPKRCPDCRRARNEWRRGSKLDAAIQALIQNGKYGVRPSVLGPELRPTMAPWFKV